MTRLDWRSTAESSGPRALIKGTELARAIVPGTHSRFQICAVRAWDEVSSTMTGEVYQIRDAATVSDAQVRDGIRSKVVAIFGDQDEAIKFALSAH